MSRDTRERYGTVSRLLHWGMAVLVIWQALKLFDRIDDGQGVVSVHPFSVHLFGIHAGTDAGQHIIAHGLASGLSAHAVLVVKAVHQQGQPAAQGFVPQFAVLIHG